MPSPDTLVSRAWGGSMLREIWGLELCEAVAPFGALSRSESCHYLGRGWVLALTLTPSDPGHEVPSLEAEGSSIPVPFKPACVFL